MGFTISILLFLFGVFLVVCLASGRAPDALKSYHIYKYRDKYFVKIKIFAYITLRYVDKSQPLKYTNWGVSEIDYCLVPSKKDAERLIETLKETITEVK